MRYLILLSLFILTACTQYQREITIYAEDGATLKIRDIDVLAEVKKGDESQTNKPDVSPDLNLPLGGILN